MKDAASERINLSVLVEDLKYCFCYVACQENDTIYFVKEKEAKSRRFLIFLVENHFH